MRQLWCMFLVIGCVEGSSNKNSSDTNSTEPVEDIVLQEGHWTYGEGELLSSTCPDPEEEGEETLIEDVGFTLQRLDEDTFSITPDESTDTTICKLTGQQFECDGGSGLETFTFEGDFEGVPVEMDVTLQIGSQSIGYAYSDTDVKFTFTVDFDCYSVDNPLVDCAAVSEESGLPCSIQFSVAALADQME